ncbi:hypothetical protein BHE74_00020802 [Ensete ventricosum]|nr:hypothetical protein BHE74_00020802 [Ensete ventricosum]
MNFLEMESQLLFRFLTKLLTEDLSRLFVLPKKILLDFQKGKTLGPISHGVKVEAVQERSKDFVGEMSVTLVDARKLAYPKIGINFCLYSFYDFDLFVVNPGKQKLYIQVKDSFGFADFTVGTAEVD